MGCCAGSGRTASLGGKQLLLVLDTREHVVDAAAGMAETLLRGNPAAASPAALDAYLAELKAGVMPVIGGDFQPRMKPFSSCVAMLVST
jgi:hypothetical protein